MEMQQIKVKIYLKTKRRPLLFIFDREEQISKLMDELSMQDVIRLGNIVFRANDFKYMVIK